MRISADDCARRLAASDHGVLATRHATRGVDTVPVCFAVLGSRLAVPVDVVKAKSSTALQRTTNLAGDPRASLLCERWDADDWSALWWVRATLRHDHAPEDVDVLADALRTKHAQYRGATFAALLVFDVVGLAGWAASDVPESLGVGRPGD